MLSDKTELISIISSIVYYETRSNSVQVQSKFLDLTVKLSGYFLPYFKFVLKTHLFKVAFIDKY